MYINTSKLPSQHLQHIYAVLQDEFLFSDFSRGITSLSEAPVIEQLNDSLFQIFPVQV